MELEIGQGLDYQDCKNTARSESYNEYIYLQKRNKTKLRIFIFISEFIDENQFITG